MYLIAGALIGSLGVSLAQQKEITQTLDIVKAETTRSFYANQCDLHAGRHEIILDFGTVNSSDETGRQFRIASRIALNYYTAKRLYSALSMALVRHEQAFGVIEVEHRRAKSAPRDIDVSYANFVRVSSTPEELILDTGLNPNPYARGRIQVTVSHSIIMLHSPAKILYQELGSVLDKYEKEYGRIESDVRKRLRVDAE